MHRSDPPRARGAAQNLALRHILRERFDGTAALFDDVEVERGVAPSRTHVALALLVGALTFIRSPAAGANGRFPGADQLIVDPGDAMHLLVRATFGFIETYDGGASWRWICEEVVGPIGSFDPPLAAFGDGTIVVAVPFQGVAVSHDRGCTWERAPSPLAGQLAIDLTREPGEPSSLLVLTSTSDPDAGADGGFAFVTRVVESKDNGHTWSEIGAALPSDFIAATIEMAPSDPNRIYLGGVAGNPAVDVIERSDDRGATWTRSTLPSPSAAAGALVSAVDPRDADRLWVRVLLATPDPFGMAPTELRVSADKGATFSTVAETAGGMFGFALSPDGATLAYGGPADGISIGPSDASGGFSRVSAMKNRCLTWNEQGLYACATEPFDPFAVGLSPTLDPLSFAPVYKLANTCPQECRDDSPFGQVCRASWTDPAAGVAVRTGATASACSVPWAKIADRGDGGNDSDASPDAGGFTPDANGAEALPTTGSSCGCWVGGRHRGSVWRAAALGLLALGRRSRRRWDASWYTRSMPMQEQAILLVEDSDDDAELTFRAFKKANIRNPITRVRDGVQALDYLFARGEFAARNVSDTPAVVLLDLNLPRLSGIDVLKAIRAEERIKHIPVVVLTSSNEERDLLAAYREYANSYVQKPVDYDQFVMAAKDLGLYWLVLNQAPPRDSVKPTQPG